MVILSGKKNNKLGFNFLIFFYFFIFLFFLWGDHCSKQVHDNFVPANWLHIENSKFKVLPNDILYFFLTGRSTCTPNGF